MMSSAARFPSRTKLSKIIISRGWTLEFVRKKSMKVKKHHATSYKHQTAATLALQHFDFFYEPIYGPIWPSIRLALLSDPKYMAIINRSANYAQAHEELSALGAIDMIAHIKAENPVPSSSSKSSKTSSKRTAAIDAGAVGSSYNPYSFDEIIKEDDGSDQRINTAGGRGGARVRAENDGDDAYQTRLSPQGRVGDSGDSRVRPPVQKIRLTNKEDHDRDSREFTDDDRENPNLYVKDEGVEIDEDEVVRLKTVTQLRVVPQFSDFPPGGPTILVEDDPFSVHDIPELLRVMTFPVGDISFFPAPSINSRSVKNYYLMDGASLFPAISMDLQKGDKVLDLCAAPGGKAIIMMQMGRAASITVNDSSTSRLERMRQALLGFIPPGDDMRSRMIIHKLNANTPAWDLSECFNKVLVDVTCTTDKHAVINNNDWADNLFRHSKKQARMELPDTQARILMTGLRSVLPGGCVVYSTCTMSPLQNENVVQKAIEGMHKAYPHHQYVVMNQKRLCSELSKSKMFRFAKNIRYGHLIAPFLPSNFGPMYTCKIQRKL